MPLFNEEQLSFLLAVISGIEHTSSAFPLRLTHDLGGHLATNHTLNCDKENSKLVILSLRNAQSISDRSTTLYPRYPMHITTE